MSQKEPLEIKQPGRSTQATLKIKQPFAVSNYISVYFFPMAALSWAGHVVFSNRLPQRPTKTSGPEGRTPEHLAGCKSTA